MSRNNEWSWELAFPNIHNNSSLGFIFDYDFLFLSFRWFWGGVGGVSLLSFEGMFHFVHGRNSDFSEK